MKEQTMDSTSDQRTANNVMRHQYRVLSQADKDDMQALKDHGLKMYELLDRIGQTGTGVNGSRELSIAKTKVEEAVMWGVKHITR